MTEFELLDNRRILNNFIEYREIDPQYKLPKHIKRFGYVYCIENKKNGKKYIGSSYSRWMDVKNPSIWNQLRKRATNYIYDYNNLAKSIKEDPRNINSGRPIIRAMYEEGIENFIMYPLAETIEEQHFSAEEYFIKKYDTVKNGYNFQSVNGKYRRFRNHMGTPHTEAEKKKRSTEVICISPSTKKIIFADSMKLFGDYMNSSKDMIKNSVRKCRPYKGWYCFYTDYDKRNHIIETNVLGEGLARGDRHSKESAEISVEFHNEITEYLKNKDSKVFQEYSVEELRYNV
nr:MAG TPA: GIY-YIG nuclease superfamily protein [Caudoviricetes sp.]